MLLACVPAIRSPPRTEVFPNDSEEVLRNRDEFPHTVQVGYLGGDGDDCPVRHVSPDPARFPAHEFEQQPHAQSVPIFDDDHQVRAAHHGALANVGKQLSELTFGVEGWGGGCYHLWEFRTPHFHPHLCGDEVFHYLAHGNVPAVTNVAGGNTDICKAATVTNVVRN